MPAQHVCNTTTTTGKTPFCSVLPCSVLALDYCRFHRPSATASRGRFYATLSFQIPFVSKAPLCCHGLLCHSASAAIYMLHSPVFYLVRVAYTAAASTASASAASASRLQSLPVPVTAPSFPNVGLPRWPATLCLALVHFWVNILSSTFCCRRWRRHRRPLCRLPQAPLNLPIFIPPSLSPWNFSCRLSTRPCQNFGCRPVAPSAVDVAVALKAKTYNSCTFACSSFFVCFFWVFSCTLLF